MKMIDRGQIPSQILAESLDEAFTRTMSRRRFLTGTALTGAGFLLPSFLKLQPAEADRLGLQMPTVAQQKQVGQQGAAQVFHKYYEVTDGRARHFKAIGERLIRALPASQRNTWDFSFHVLTSKEVNAFALPGGPMFMFTGLYEKLTTDDAVAGVTGHELTHVWEQHWAKSYAKQNREKAAIGAGLILTRAPLSAAVLAVLARHALDLRYSRGEEDQADQGGLQDMIGAGYNPNGMLELFATLDKLQKAEGSAPPAWLSDHPQTKARYQATQKRIAAYGANHTWPAETPLNYAKLVG
jgi:beta-barrel assembly-enhancing protease